MMARRSRRSRRLSPGRPGWMARAAGASRARAGFTLISVIIAMVLLSVGVLALAGANATALRVYNTEGVRTNAVQIARSHVETLRGRDPSTLTSEPSVAVNELGTPTVDGRYQRSVTVTTLEPTLLNLTVTVTAPVGRPVVLETQIYRPVW